MGKQSLVLGIALILIGGAGLLFLSAGDTWGPDPSWAPGMMGPGMMGSPGPSGQGMMATPDGTPGPGAMMTPGAIPTTPGMGSSGMSQGAGVVTGMAGSNPWALGLGVGIAALGRLAFRGAVLVAAALLFGPTARSGAQ